MVPLLLLAISLIDSYSIERDSFGVPLIQEPSFELAMEASGYAVAQDRIWQMELSRRLARGKLAEALGPNYVSSDREILESGYSDEELQAQFNHLSRRSRLAIESYVRGVNRYIDGISPGAISGFSQHQVVASHWNVLDSVAISIHLLRQFGRGGAGEIRNMAALTYLKSQKRIGDKFLDVWDDLCWFNDPKAVTTLQPEDDVLRDDHYHFYIPDRQTTINHVSHLPKTNLFELMGGLKVASLDASTLAGKTLGTPFRTGSYCVVVSPKRSTTGSPILLAAPQMGMHVPSIVHEMTIRAPGLEISGMDVPGIPGIIIGRTQNLAWGITSGVADTDDIFYYPFDGKQYKYGKRALSLHSTVCRINVKDSAPQFTTRKRTLDGPVVLQSPASKTIFAKKSSYWMHEMDSFDAWVKLWSCKDADSIERTMDHASMNFNFFYATRSGDIGWKYLGRIPKRAKGIDSRFPTPAKPEFAWKGMLKPEEMPHVRNPKSGCLFNWNNKPVSWWTNSDTPAWGEIFEVSSLQKETLRDKLSPLDLEEIPRQIAIHDETWPYFKPYLTGWSLHSFDGRKLEGSMQAASYDAFVNRLRERLFLSTTGNFLNKDYFNLILQPSVIIKALRGQTRFDYLAGKSAQEIVAEVMNSQTAGSPLDPYLAPFHPDTFKTAEAVLIPYSNRGSYTLIVDFQSGQIKSKSVLSPGVAETGDHSNDQSSLARSWNYKANLAFPPRKAHSFH